MDAGAWKIAGVAALGILALGGALSLLGFFRERRKALGPRAEAPPPAIGLAPEPSIEAAIAAAASGDYGLGVALVRESCLGLFEARGLLRRLSSMTTGDVMRRIPSEAAAAFRPIARGADARSFGAKPIGEKEWAEAERGWAELSKAQP